MRTKAILTSILLATTLASVASADPIVRDHREQPQLNYYQSRARFTRGARVQSRPMWQQWSAYNQGYNVGYTTPTYNPSYSSGYGYQVDDDDDVMPPTQGYVDGVSRGEWMVLGTNIGIQDVVGGRSDIDLDGRPLRAIEVQATRGSSYVGEVHVELMDGREIKLAPEIQLDIHTPNIRLDLGEQCSVGVRRIEIFGQANTAGLVRVLGA